MDFKNEKFPVFSVFFLGLFILGTSVGAFAQTITLEEEVKVQSPPFTLNALTSNDLSNKISGISLGSLPKPGESRLISRAYIRMQARLQDQPVPSFSGDVRQVTVRRPSRELGRKDLESKVERVLTEELTVTDGVEIEILDFPQTVSVLPGSVDLRLEGWNPYQKQRGASWYRISVFQRGHRTNTFRVKASLHQNNKVPVAAKPIARKQLIKSQHIKWETRDISRMRGNIINKKEKVVGFEADRNFKPGDVITGGDLAKPILIERRSPVTIEHRKNGLMITTKGMAMEKGARGDRIMVKNRSSEVELQAEVISERRVLIETDE